MDGSRQLGIRLREVRKSFGAQTALNGIDLDVEPGGYLAVMGANGAGKTTLLNVISGLAVPTSGSVTVAGVEMRRAGSRLRALIGVAGHETMLYADLTGRENLHFFAKLFGVPGPTQAVERVAGLLRVEEALDRPVRTLSRGTKQRVSLARALVHDPAVLLLDEPYSGLDEAAALELSEILDGLHGPHRVLIVTLHEVARAISGPERLVVLSHGRVVLDQPTHGSGTDVADAYLGVLRSEVRS